MQDAVVAADAAAAGAARVGRINDIGDIDVLPREVKMRVIPRRPQVREVDRRFVHRPVVAEAARVVVGHAQGDQLVVTPFVAGVGAVDDDGAVGHRFAEARVGRVGFVRPEVLRLADRDVDALGRGGITLTVDREVAERGVGRNRERARVERTCGRGGGAIQSVADPWRGIGVVRRREGNDQRWGRGDGVCRAV